MGGAAAATNFREGKFAQYLAPSEPDQILKIGLKSNAFESESLC
jgi:hypothetical protein